VAVGFTVITFGLMFVGMFSCTEEVQPYIYVYFMSEGYGYNTVEYNPGDYICVEAHTPIVFEFPATVELIVTTNEGDEEILCASWVEDPDEPDYYVHRASIKMVAPENPVRFSNFIETHIGASIMVEYHAHDDLATDTAYVSGAD